MLCERCQKRDATVFLTMCYGNSGGDSQESSVTSRNFCEECFETYQPEEFANMQARLEAGCRFCGKKCGATFCRTCLTEFRRITELKGLKFEGALTAEGREAMMRIMREVEEHMAEWVLKRGPGDSDEPEEMGGAFLPWAAAFQNLAAADSRFTVEAYRFVAEAVSSAVDKVSTSDHVHVSGGDICEALRALAILRYGKEALPTLQGWGIHSTDDIGAVLYRMIETRIFGASPEDRIEDFHAVYDFGSAFPVT